MSNDVDFTLIYQKYFHDVYLFLLAMSRNSNIAEELTQETFCKALTEMKHFRGDCTAKTWLCKIAKNLYISYTRKQKNIPLDHREYHLSALSAETPESSYIQKDEALSIYRILQLLDEPYKEVFTLRTLGELEYREISAIFDKTENWARVTYYRARAKIREQLDSQAFSNNERRETNE